MDNITPEQLAKHISALRDSVNLINDCISSENIDQQTLDDIKRNYQHIETMLAKDFIINSGEDLAQFEAAVVAGKDFIANNE